MKQKRKQRKKQQQQPKPKVLEPSYLAIVPYTPTSKARNP